MLRRLAIVVAALLIIVGCGDDGGERADTAVKERSGLPTVAVADLPPEARATLELVAGGGPFPYDRDGAVFENRERLLPREARGYYHEYTVPTPGSRDRGARRIVTGDEGERFYTDDHYASFKEVVES